ncbi:MAG: DUF2142 domain-containing protein, partial [Anaerolineales bacterium]|nr:DUF2142 domain-containing protein [Anaerolineales bacterium]
SLLNSILFIITLLLLFFHGFRYKLLTFLGIALLSIPQVTYLFAYANSDAWALAVSTLLFLYVFIQQDDWVNTPAKFIIIGLMTGILLASKKSFWVSFSYIYLLVGWDLLQAFRKHQIKTSIVWLNLGLLIFLACLVPAPIKIIYPLTQDTYIAAVRDMRETHAREDLRPSDPSLDSYRLKSKGTPFTAILSDKVWLTASLKSFYGLFGHMSVPSPEPVYILVASLTIFMIILTVNTLIKCWGRITVRNRLLAILSPGVILANIFFSMFVSWVQDYQPQGRYLFASIVPLVVLLGVTYEYEGRRIQVARNVVWVLLLLLNVYILWDIVIINPALG